MLNIREFLTTLYSRGLLLNNFLTIEIINFVTSAKKIAVCVFVLTFFSFQFSDILHTKTNVHIFWFHYHIFII